MSAVTIPLSIERSATFTHRFTWKPNGSVADLTGATAKMQMRPTVQSDTVLVELSTANGRITLGGNTGTIDLLLSADITANLSGNRAVYDLEITQGEVVTRLVEGAVTIVPNVTR